MNSIATSWAFSPIYGVFSNPAYGETVVKVDFKELWETSNRVNQIYNPTPKDDPPPTASNKLYVVESPDDNKYHVTLDVDDAPACLRTQLMWAVYMDGSKLAESNFPASGPATNVVFDHPTLSDLSLKDFEIHVGYDWNGNHVLETTEEIALHVTNANGRVIGTPTVKGASIAKYTEYWAVLWAGGFYPFTPQATALVTIFFNGNTTSIGSDKQPTQTNAVSFNCYSDPYCVWLTHNAGAPFNSSGTATIQQYVWGTNTSFANLTCTAYPMELAAQSIYNTTVLTAANAFFATNPVGTIATFPLDGTSYNIPHTDESPSWVATYLSGVTVTFSSSDTNGLLWTALGDDAYVSIGRGQLMSHTATFTIEKKTDIFGSVYLEVESANYAGVVEDLYDFNAEDTGLGGKAAIVQLGHGNGSYGSGRSSGVIYKDRIEFNQSVNSPFP